MKPSFSPGHMWLKYSGPEYRSGGRARRHPLPPGLRFYSRLFAGPFLWLGLRASRNLCDDIAWVYGSNWVAEILESVGGRLEIEGLEHLEPDRPRVYVANHMSTLETFLLPGILRPHGPVTFVVKRSLVNMPVFGPIMRSRDPVVVDRKNPRHDLTAVLDGGAERLARGTSIVVFPQSTRMAGFDPSRFNSIGVKLARRAGVEAIPLALKTDAMGRGKLVRDFGRLRPDLPVRFKFGRPMRIEGAGKAEHESISAFIAEHLARWQKNDGVNE